MMTAAALPDRQEKTGWKWEQWLDKAGDVAHALPAMVLFFLFLFLPLTFAFVLTTVVMLCKPGCAISAADTSSV